MIDLCGAKLKIERTNQHILDIDKAKAAFFALNPYKLTPEYYAESNITAYFLDEYSPVPHDISLLVGDAVHNLRSALDFLAYALASDARPGADLNHIYFPISESLAKYKSQLAGKTKGIPKPAIDAISLIKPYGGGNDDLWGLHLLDIIDKHRLLVTTAMITDKIWFEVDVERVNNAFRGVFNLPPKSVPKQSVSFPAPVPIQSPRKGAALHSVAGNHEADQDVQFTFDIAFGETEIFKGKPVIPTLSQLAHLVDGIVASFT